MSFSIQISDHQTPADKVDEIRVNPGFALHPSDHMATARWSNGEWHDFAIQPYQPLVLDPRAMSLHYGQAIFEGLKAFPLDDGSVAAFRPEANAERFALSAERMAMPPFPTNLFVEACEELVRIDQRWIPTAPGTSFYIRPYMFATEPHIGVRAALEFQFVVIALPAAPFFSATFSSIAVAVLNEYTRAAKGGTGEAKCAGNYGASLLPKQMAKKLGCDEVLWLDASGRGNIEELSGMNVCFVEKRPGDTNRLITPILGGTILRGVTRDSLLQVAGALGYGVEERDITIDEIETRVGSGEVTEGFALGTAAVIAPIGKIVRPEKDDIVFGTGEPGETTTKLYDELIAIQRGRSDRFPEWRHIIPGAKVMEASPSL